MRLTLHFDINGTITSQDSTDDATPRENANMVVAKSIYGQRIGTAWISDVNYLNSQPHTISYYDYCKATDPVGYRQMAYQFTDPDKAGQAFAPMVDYIMASAQSFLFPSFLRAIDAFPEALITIRTFGQDTAAVADRLEAHDPVRFARHKSSGVLYDQASFNDLNVIYIQEDYVAWNKQGRAKQHGKQLKRHPELFQIFFDDNDCVHVPEPDETTHFVRVNTLDAMQDDEFFVKQVKRIFLP